MKPPAASTILREMPVHLIANAIAHGDFSDQQSYEPWDTLRHKTPPQGLTSEQWWAVTRLRRKSASRALEHLTSIDGAPFNYSLPDTLLRDTDYISRKLSASTLIPSKEIPQDLQDHFLVSAFEEEAIRSSQLEGAVTSRRRAKEMLARKSPPINHSERMIVNNYQAIRFVYEHKNEELSAEFILRLHAIVTAGTLSDASLEGTIQSKSADRVQIWGDGDQLLFTPPPVEQLPDRLAALCAFANSATESYLPDPLKAVTLHFMMGYNHFFEDGNGRTARALFYWYMLKRGYWLTQYISISQFLREAPAKYARAYLNTEWDENDLTYFFLHQTRTIVRAISSWEAYLERKQAALIQQRRTSVAVPELDGLNDRQLWVVTQSARDESLLITAYALAEQFGVVPQSARLDLLELERRGLLERLKQGRKIAWTPTALMFRTADALS